MNKSLIDDLRSLLIAGKVKTQEDICIALQSKGHEIAQSKVSRLLRKLGAVKSKNELGQIVYRLPLEPAPPTSNSQLSSLIINITANESLAIVNTSPGSAQLIARVLDYHKKELQLLGTIAGDDTILVIPKSIKNIHTIVKKIHHILGLE